MTNKLWKLLDLLEITTHHFKKNGIENARLNAERLLSHVLDIDRVQLYLQYERLLTNSEIESYRELVRRRSQHEPLQYITSETEFMGLPFQINSDVLIPRPETESLVEHALEHLKGRNTQSPLIWDVGTGSGCIAVSLAHHYPTCRVIASDISDAALTVARNNARLNDVIDKIEFTKHNFLVDAIPDKKNFDLIISNPPYVTAEEWNCLPKEIHDFEPSAALTDHNDGLTFYKRFFEISGQSYFNYFILELSGTQFKKIIKLAENLNFKNIRMTPDLNEIPRILEITVK